MEVFLIAFSYVIVFIFGILLGVFAVANPIVKKVRELELPNIDEKDYLTDDGKYFTSRRKVKGDDE
jgi:uncharacterized protein YneF (UPF0154 family)